jgi:hypothetical protein
MVPIVQEAWWALSQPGLVQKILPPLGKIQNNPEKEINSFNNLNVWALSSYKQNI